MTVFMSIFRYKRIRNFAHYRIPFSDMRISATTIAIALMCCSLTIHAREGEKVGVLRAKAGL
jgi:hypothetical protein